MVQTNVVALEVSTYVLLPPLGMHVMLHGLAELLKKHEPPAEQT